MKIKLLNFTICQLIIFVLSLHCYVECEMDSKESSSVQRPKVTVYEKPFEKILKRRKRFLVYRPLSNLLLTASLVKPLVSEGPSGVTTIIEWDMYFPLPTTWKKATKPPKVKPVEVAPPPPPPPLPVMDTMPSLDTTSDLTPQEWAHDHPGEVYMPPDLFNSLNMGKDAMSMDSSDMGKDASMPMDSSAMDNSNGTKKYWNNMPTNWNENSIMEPASNGYSPPAAPMLNRRFPLGRPPVTRYGNPLLNGRYSLGRSPAWQSPKYRNQGNSYYSIRGKRSIEEKSESLEDWEHYHGHRDRRELYRQFVTAFGQSFDVHSCLLRTVCEVQHFLLPPGYSLLQDIFRVLFTVPLKKGLEDDFTDAMKAKEEDCHVVYGKSCPMSILSFLLHAKN